MKYLLIISILLSIFTSCKKEISCGDGEVLIPFTNKCRSENVTYYLGKPSFYCFDDSLAIGVNIEEKTLNALYKGAKWNGAKGSTHYHSTGHISRRCITDEYGESNTVVYFDDVSLLDELPASFTVSIYQEDWNIPYTKRDSTFITMYKR